MENICEAGWGETRSIGGAKPGAGASLRQLWLLQSSVMTLALSLAPGPCPSKTTNSFLNFFKQITTRLGLLATKQTPTACDIVTCLNFILGTIKFIAWAQIPIICHVNTSGDNKDTQLHSDRGMAHMMSKLDDITQA